MSSSKHQELNPDVLQGRLVTFYVGETAQEISVHKNLLRRHSAVFEAVFRKPPHHQLPFLSGSLQGVVQEHLHGGIILPARFDVEAVQKIVNYCYRGTVPEMSESPALVIKVYELALDLGMTLFADLIMDRLQVFNGSVRSLKMSEVQTIFDHRATAKGMLWVYAMIGLAQQLVKGTIPKKRGAKVQEFCAKNPEVAQGIVDIQVTYGRGMRNGDTDYTRPSGQGFSPCHFHVHHPQDLCSRAYAASPLPVIESINEQEVEDPSEEMKTGEETAGKTEGKKVKVEAKKGKNAKDKALKRHKPGPNIKEEYMY